METIKQILSGVRESNRDSMILQALLNVGLQVLTYAAGDIRLSLSVKLTVLDRTSPVLDYQAPRPANSFLFRCWTYRLIYSPEQSLLRSIAQLQNLMTSAAAFKLSQAETAEWGMLSRLLSCWKCFDFESSLDSWKLSSAVQTGSQTC